MASKEELKKIKEMIKKVVGEFGEAKQQMDELKEWKTPSDWLQNIEKVSQCVEMVVSVGIELQKFMSDLSDEELVNAIAEFLDDEIKFPKFIEPFDKFAFKLIVAYVLKTCSKFLPGAPETSMTLKARKLVEGII